MLYTPNLQSPSNLPVYIALYEAIKRDIVGGKLRPSDRLPSIRALAKNLSISTTPVETAYQQLIAEGFMESRPRRGFYITQLPDSYGKLALNDSTFSSLNFIPPEDAAPVYSYDFHMSKNDFISFPLRAWRRLLNHTLLEEYKELLYYGDPLGEAGLRNELAAYLYRFRGVVCRPEQIVIGAEQHLLMNYLAITMKDLSPGIAVENPCYPLIPYAFQAQGYELFPVTEADKGISISRLGNTDARIVAVSPSHQFPGGRVMPFHERLELLEWAKENHAYIIEDDYGGELRYYGQPIPALQGLGSSANVIYVGGFSQILAPDLCIHYMVLPEALLEPFRKITRRLMVELSSSRVYQRTLQRFMEQGHFEKHVRRMRNLYRKKNRKLADTLEVQFQGVGEVMNAEAGLHLILKIRTPASEQEMVDAVRPYGIRVAAATPFYSDDKSQSGEKKFIIGFGGIELEKIEEGICRLRELWSRYL
ncbi:PLP-dependent aminotransferase family protein [Cohnella thailandensis]|uniref:PLP-dependent aminotransferase family protein n=2 Tax=Cohnella thailandensis TaxID=557557 RepID=A0A841SWF9_9BACL|nr:PLP-dependent aminotransferase family protein [Cohnella thailandensis]